MAFSQHIRVLSLILKVQLNTIFKPAWVPALDCFHKMAPFSSEEMVAGAY